MRWLFAAGGGYDAVRCRSSDLTATSCIVMLISSTDADEKHGGTGHSTVLQRVGGVDAALRRQREPPQFLAGAGQVLSADVEQ